MAAAWRGLAPIERILVLGLALSASVVVGCVFARTFSRAAPYPPMYEVRHDAAVGERVCVPRRGSRDHLVACARALGLSREGGYIRIEGRAGAGGGRH